jgi:hypothetical protein
MSMHLRTLPLTSDEILKELVAGSLPNIFGESFEVISDNLPFEGNHILALDSARRPTIISYDTRDGGRALLSGLAVIEGLTDNRAMLYRLYPALFRGNQQAGSIFRVEEMRLVVLASNPPPGGAYLAHAFRSLTVYTFRILEIDGKIGLLIESPRPGEPGAVNPLSHTPTARPAFRPGGATLSPEEESFFRQP